MLDEAWDNGALHEFKVVFAGAVPGQPDYDEIRGHYDRALVLSGGQSAGLHVAYAEAVSVPTQNSAEFREMMEQALAVDPDANPGNRLVNLIAQRRATWLLERIEDDGASDAMRDEARLLRARAFEQSGKAESALERYLDLDPFSSAADDVRDLLDSM